MGERKGTNKYYPPDFDPAKHGSLNGYHKTHALRERARKLSQGILIIRFEMPYNIWCEGCGKHIGMGVRYNAEKTKVGKYYTTPIHRFRMKCHLCDNYIEIQTDPANCDYVIVSGARRKEERWDMKDNEQVLTTAREDKEKLETDAMFRLEHGVKDKEKLTRAVPGLADIQTLQEVWRDDFQLNSKLRRRFREEKRVLQETKDRDDDFCKRTSLSIPLVAESSEDSRLASLLKLHAPISCRDQQRRKRHAIAERPWFDNQVAKKSHVLLSRINRHRPATPKDGDKSSTRLCITYKTNVTPNWESESIANPTVGLNNCEASNLQLSEQQSSNLVSTINVDRSLNDCAEGSAIPTFPQIGGHCKFKEKQTVQYSHHNAGTCTTFSSTGSSRDGSRSIIAPLERSSNLYPSATLVADYNTSSEDGLSE
uniref:Probable splicing factor YJU2B n=1 Tax=Eptatretus burgeri TaxID=7764 RepID=A0A8C4R035_EPTBU